MTALEPLPAPLIVPPAQAEMYLRAMDIDIEDVYAAVAAGERAAGALDPFAPSLAPGIVCWIEVVTALRRRLAGTGKWGIDDRRGQPVCRHLESGRTLAIISGDEATGNPENPCGPQAVRRKGTATAKSLQRDEVLFPLAALIHRRPKNGALGGAWVLLYRRTTSTIHLEVSQPVGFDQQEGRFTGWSVRVILDDWRPADQEQPPLGLIPRHVDFQMPRVA